MKHVVVIGSNSFSGAYFIDYLLRLKQYVVTGVSRSAEKPSVFLPYKQNPHPNFRFLRSDINTQAQSLLDMLDREKPAYIFNFAAQVEVAPSWDHPYEYFQTNTQAVLRIVHHLSHARYPFRFIQISTPEVYGSCDTPVKEDGMLNPSTPYAASKAAADLAIMTFFKQYRFPVMFVRSTNVYGPFQPLFKVIPKCIMTIKKSQMFPLHGGGKAVKTYIHIHDVCRAMHAIMENGSIGEIYHVSSDDVFPINHIIQEICTQMCVRYSDVVDVVGERPGQDKAYLVDSAKIRKLYSWKPQIEFSRGIRDVIEWVEKNWVALATQNTEYVFYP